MGKGFVQRVVHFRQKGDDGASISSANVWYALKYGTGTPENSEFTLNSFPTTLNAGYYVWQITKVTYSDGRTPEYTGKMLLGPTSDFLSGTEVYAISQSNSMPPDENETNWKTTYTKTKGYYLWTATRVQYTNGSYGYLNKKCVGYWGEDGTSVTFYELLPSVSVIPRDKNKNVKITTISFTAYKHVGNNRTEVSGWSTEGLTLYYIKNGSSVAVSGRAYSNLGNIYNNYDGIIEWCIKKNNIIVAKVGIGCSDDGQTGPSNVEYRLMCSISSVTFSRDYAGVVSANPSSYQLYIKKIEGSTESVINSDNDIPSGYSVMYKEYRSTGITAWQQGQRIGTQDPLSELNNGSYSQIDYGLFYGDELIQELSVVSRWEFLRMLVPAGEWNSTTEYVITDNTVPLVLYDGKYWYLNDDASKNDVPTEETSAGSYGVWKRAREYEVILTKMLFADFAKMGGFIVYGNFFYSRYGTLVSPNSNIAVNASNVDTNYTSGSKTAPPYGWFDPTDPMVATSPESGYKFAPIYSVNAVTGATYQSNAYLSGKVIAKAGGQIGGFSIDELGLKYSVPESDMSDDNDVGYVSVVNTTYGRDAKIGANVLPEDIGGISAVGSFENRDATTYAGLRKTNIALILNARNGSRNFALWGYGNGMLNGSIEGYKLNAFTPSSTSNTIPIKEGNRVLICNSSYKNVFLPDLTECRNFLLTTGAFAMELTIMMGEGTDSFKIYGYTGGTTTSNLPHIRSNNEYEDLTGGIEMSQGDILQLMLVYDGSAFNAFVISYRL